MANKTTSHEKFDEIHHRIDLTAAYLKGSYEELDSYMRYVADREADLNIYEEVRSNLNSDTSDRCIVFIGNNYFVERTIAGGKQMLDRMILEKKNFLRVLKSDVAAVEKRIQCIKCVNMDGNGQIEIYEKFEGPSKKNTKRIAHAPKDSRDTVTVESKPPTSKVEPLVSSENKEIKYNGREGAATEESKDVAEPEQHADYVGKLLETKPKGISDKDFLNFMRVVDLLVSDDDDEDDESEDDYETGNYSEVTADSKEHIGGSSTVNTKIDKRKEEKHVHFSDRLCDFRKDSCNGNIVESGVDENVAGPVTPLPRQQNEPHKPILRNKGEISPINESWMRKIKVKEEPKKRQVISQKLFSDSVFERNVEAFPGTSKEKPSPRNVSEFKKKQMSKRKK